MSEGFEGIEQYLRARSDLSGVSAPAAPMPAPHWHWTRRVLFRFGFVYFLLYALQELCMFPAQIVAALLRGVVNQEWAAKLGEPYSKVFEWLFKPMSWCAEGWDFVVRWTATHAEFLHANVTIGPNGSGDTTWNYVQLVLIFAGAVAGCVIWSAIAEPLGFKSHARVASIGRILCRYYLVCFMFSYGFAKVFRSQFGPPTLLQLTTRFGDFSPMGLLWKMMGYSTPYNVFTGGGEVLSGLLLAFRRTTTLGALVGAAVMINVVMLNFCFDVPVKLFSTHLLLFMGALTARDGARLVNVLVLNRGAAPAPLAPHSLRRIVIEALVLGVILWSFVGDELTQSGQLRADTKPPLYGLYEVEEVVQDGVIVPPLMTDATRWRQAIIDVGYTRTETSFQQVTKLVVRTMDEKLVGYVAEIDVDHHAMTLKTQAMTAMADKDPKSFALTYTEPAPGKLVVEGTLEGKAVKITLQRRDESSFFLLSRGFHWINEQPINR